MTADTTSEIDPQAVKAKWTVMVFMGAATIEGNEPLIDAAEADLAEMQFVGSGPALDDETGERRGDLEIIVQVHQGKHVAPRRGRITREKKARIDTLEEVPEHLRDTADGWALLNFINWALEEAKHGKDDRTLLVLWGHAYDFAIGRAHTRGGTIDSLDFAELSRVLKTLQQKFGVGRKLDILGCDACDLATVEMACQLKPFASYLLCSQIGIPIPGWPYDRVLYRLRHPNGAIMNPAELGTWTVRRFCETYSAESRTVSLTLLDLTRAEELFEAAAVLALALASTIGDVSARDRIAYLFSQSQTGPGKPYVDVADLCLNLVRNSGDTLVIEAARDLGNFLLAPQLELVGTRGTRRAFVIEHGRNTCETARLNGISIYAPNVAPHRDFDAVQHMYHNFDFAQQTRWSGLVHALARSR